MACYKPLTAYRTKEKNAHGKMGITFNPSMGYADMRISIPCGQCIGCRLERSRQWAIRCMHEKSLHENSCFITLTYENKNLPENGTLVKKHFQDFMKRLRKHFEPTKIRFFHCGEYGEKLGRPHYHAIIFGIDFSDSRDYISYKGKIRSSETLSKIWPYGFNTVGEVTFESAAYVARYIMKKVTGDDAEYHYNSIDCDTNEIRSKQPEYITMSRRPGIGANWIKKYLTEVYNNDSIIMRGKEMKPPRFYDKKYELVDWAALDIIKDERQAKIKDKITDNTPERLAVREQVAAATLKKSKRNYEND